jgi:hypothetical protein
MRKIIWPVVFTFFLPLIYSCDPLYSARIFNKTNKEVLIELQFDRKEYGNDISSLVSNIGVDTSLVSVDTINLAAVFKLKPNEEFPVDAGMGTEPKFTVYRMISIFTKDTLRLDSHAKMLSACKKAGIREYVIEIN